MAERSPPVKAKYVRLTIEATNSAEPCIDELEVYASDPAASRGRAAPVNLALATTGAKATSSGNLAGFAIHKLEHVNDGKYGNSQSWISATPGSGWVQIELKEPAEIERIVWGRDRNGAYADRLATKYKIEVAVEEGKWRLVARSEDS